jgi:DNA repair protein RecN (Recombination protein N)
MLARLSISNYALIDSLEIAFSPELNIITGETGAGKSIILGALSLILGQRAESRYFFNQQKKCIIEGAFRITDYSLSSFFTDNELDYEDETVLRREITADGKSRAFINDTPVTLAVLKQLGEQLIDIHSQHATLEINNEDFQLLVVDILAGHDLLLRDYRENYRSYRETLVRLTRLTEESERSKSDTDYYRFQLDELDSAALIDGEQASLEAELALLTHAEEIKRNLSGANWLISDSDTSILNQLKESLSQLQQAKKYATELEELEQRLQSTYIEIKDIGTEIDRIDQHTVVDERRAEEISNRLNVIYGLQQKHRVSTVAELLEIKSSIAAKLDQVLFSDEEIEQLKARRDALHAELVVLSDNLSASRNEVIPGIETKVTSMLTEVGMPNAVFKIESTRLPEEEFNRNGRDVIRFLFSANKGQVPAPMNKVASGGELSRLMLSIKSLISRHTALPAIIFDEIDTGISGETALKVGTIMEKLSEGMQVIAITHLPQIAGKGNAHYKVFKEELADRTLTNIRLLSAEERVTEVATMLSGDNPGEFALQHARTLLGN